jgi:flagellin
MGLTVNLNSASLAAYRTLSANNTALSKSIERLSSGYKINSAGDDPAGLVITEKLQAQIGGLNAAIKNAGDAVNMVKTAEGALQEVNRLLRSMRDLAVHAANAGANDEASAAADQTQVANAIASLNKIADETQFGNKKLLDGSAGLRGLVTGSSVTGASLSYATSLKAADVISVNVGTAAERASVTTNVDISSGIGSAGSFYVNGVKVDYADTDTNVELVAKVNAVQSQSGVFASVDGNFVKFESVAYGSDARVDLVGLSADVNGAATASDAGADVVATVTVGGVAVSDANWNAGKGTQLKDSLGNTIDLTVAAATTTGDKGAQFLMSGGALVFQVGAYAGQTRTLNLGDAHASGLGASVYSGENVSTINVVTDAQHAIDILDAAIKEVSTMRAELGATQKNVFESSISSLTIAKENISASASSIKDTDMASEMVEFTKLQVLNQVGTAMLAQANQAPQSLLKLLQ